MRSTMPRSSNTSSVRGCTPLPREPWNGCAAASISRKSTLRRARSIARVRPAAPAPQIRTSMVSMVSCRKRGVPSVQLQLKTWQFVEEYLKSKTGIIIPIGSTEQHGPTGLIGTDALTAEMIGRGVGEKVGALVAPTISVGMAQHHLAFPGSMTVRPTTLIALIRDQVMSLARHGFSRFYFLNGHGGNVVSVTASFSEIYAERSMEKLSNQPPIRCVLRNWWESSGVKALRSELYGNAEGSHATPSEVALTWYRFPETMQQKPME